MPRASIEARAAAAWRVKPHQLAPPAYLSPAAKKLWKDIIETRPPDYFRAGSLQLLEQFCETMIAQRAALTELARASQSADPDRLAAAVRTVKDLAGIINLTAAKLRLATQTERRIEDCMTDEVMPAGNHLLAGHLRPLRPVS